MELHPVPPHRTATSSVAAIPRITDLKSSQPLPTVTVSSLHGIARDSGCIGFAGNVDYFKFFAKAKSDGGACNLYSRFQLRAVIFDNSTFFFNCEYISRVYAIKIT